MCGMTTTANPPRNARADQLRPTVVRTREQVEKLRRVRNACRSFMTRDQSWISPVRQEEWWTERDRRAVKVFLYRSGASRTVVGYGLLRKSQRKTWLSGGLLARFRGKGLGRALFLHLCAEAGGATHLEVLRSNVRARKTYASLGFVVVRRRRDLIVMRRASSKTRAHEQSAARGR